MGKIIFNLRVLSASYVKLVITKDENNLQLELLNEFTTHFNQEATLKHLAQQINSINKKYPETPKILNLIYEDSALASLQVIQDQIEVNQQDLKLHVQNLKDLPSLLNKQMEAKYHSSSHVVSIIPTITACKVQNLTKWYKKIPTNKPFDKLTQFFTIYQVNKREDLLYKVKSLFLDCVLSKTNIYFKSQLAANLLANQSKASYLVNLGLQDITITQVAFGKVIAYTKTKVGTSSFLTTLAQKQHLSKKSLIQRLKYLSNVANKYNQLDVNLTRTIEYYDSFMRLLINRILQSIALINMQNNAKILTKIAFSGELAWMVKYLRQSFAKQLPEQYQILDWNNSQDDLLSSKIDQVMLCAMQLSTKVVHEDDQNQTQTSQIQLERKLIKKTWLNKLVSFISKRSLNE